ncbi:hypothetical protein QYF61_018002 [Mycteria americana]|uniref:Integrase catalytic domain-containing protein n=1 Tax=Mycteria americana TaxID=33587 RepID=A0AAN7NK10_MYCAM|nr:hypothetical protein QYF61_018002 [Mycteria americana]
MVEVTTGWLEIYPVPHATTRNTILGLEKQVLWRHGTPERIEFDNRTNFQNNLIDTGDKEHGTEWVYHIPYHTPASRKIEQYNGVLKATLRAMGHLVIEGDQVGQAGPAFHGPMLAGPDPLVGLHMPVEHTQEELLHNLPRHQDHLAEIQAELTALFLAESSLEGQDMAVLFLSLVMSFWLEYPMYKDGKAYFFQSHPLDPWPYILLDWWQNHSTLLTQCLSPTISLRSSITSVSLSQEHKKFTSKRKKWKNTTWEQHQIPTLSHIHSEVFNYPILSGAALKEVLTISVTPTCKTLTLVERGWKESGKAQDRKRVPTKLLYHSPSINRIEEKIQLKACGLRRVGWTRARGCEGDLNRLKTYYILYNVTPSNKNERYPQGEEKVAGSDDKATGVAATLTQAAGTAATPTPMTGSAAEPENQPVQV